MRYIYPKDDIHDEGPTLISGNTENLVHRIAAALARNDLDHAFLLAHEFRCDSHQEGQDAANKRAREIAEEENRMRAQFDHGKVEFRTKDGLVATDKISLRRDQYYQHVWKRMCRKEMPDVITEQSLDKYTPIEVRTYEFRGEITQSGLPVYHEV
jgi:hypothetical protein